MGNIMRELGLIGAAFIALATVAVIVSRNAQTPQVITAGGSAFSNILNAAVSPVSGSYSRGANFRSGFDTF